MSINTLIAVQVARNGAVYFPEAAMAEIGKFGDVTVLDTGERRTEADLAGALGDIDVCMTHWGCPCFTAAVLEKAPRLKMIAHCTGSVANLVSDAVYDRGIRVCSANNVMAKYVAEGALAYILSGLKLINRHDGWMKQGELWKQNTMGTKSLFGARVGLVGLGAVGMNLLDLLKPFNVSIKLFDPYIQQSALSDHLNVSLCSLEEALAWGDVISIHASLTQDTRHMLGAGQLRIIRDGVVLVNTARGAVIDEAVLAVELSTGRFTAVLDVYEQEPLPLESPLRRMEYVTLMPHLAGITSRAEMTFTMIEEVGRFIEGQPLQYEIPYNRYLLMTKE
jgi:phosphoglycerate dehydrogenase-like enzyme